MDFGAVARNLVGEPRRTRTFNPLIKRSFDSPFEIPRGNAIFVFLVRNLPVISCRRQAPRVTACRLYYSPKHYVGGPTAGAMKMGACAILGAVGGEVGE
jgi:hypothetical protein